MFPFLRGTRIPAAAIAVLGGLLPAAAMAQSGGATAPGAAEPQSRTPAARPSVSTAFCSQGCLGVRTGVAGSLVEVAGTRLSGASRVEFVRGRRTIAAPAVPVDDTKAWAKIPAGVPAAEYRIRIVGAGGKRSRATRKPVQVKSGGQSRFVSSAAPRIVSSEATPRRWFVGSSEGVAFQFVVRAAGSTPVVVDVMRSQGGAVIRTLQAEAPPNTLTRVVWDGRDAAGAQAPEGRYSFVSRPAGSASPGPQARSAQAPNIDSILLLQNVFPIRAAHDYGRGTGARFGSGRAGRAHQGQDVFARCGAPLVAARGGTVRFNQYHSAAGYYLVIDGDFTDVDYAYMHLRERSSLKAGTKVLTAQPIGEVGDSGNARGCHLHFELWRGVWQRGGTPYDPLPELRAWDAAS